MKYINNKNLKEASYIIIAESKEDRIKLKHSCNLFKEVNIIQIIYNKTENLYVRWIAYSDGEKLVFDKSDINGKTLIPKEFRNQF